MKLVAHYVFSAGLLLFTVRFVAPEALFFLGALWSAFAVNWAIDRLGHENANGHPRRAFATHSVFTAPWVGIIVTVLPVLIGVEAAGSHVIPYLPPMAFSLAVLALVGVIAALSHLFLDALTEGGIYTKPHHRVALAHMHYNSVAGNGLAILAGLVLAGFAFEYTFFACFI